MPKPAKLFLASGAISMLAAVAVGAFGAHALKSQLAPDLLAVYRTGVEYHFYHATALSFDRSAPGNVVRPTPVACAEDSVH